ncbi:acyltransferase family protein [Amnibacterium sp.]|uniref:acyltransferase family protein n=1 Tax=Amnibacterium sp. TaxID=1872496 RepID=UPI003F7C5B59
MTGGSSTSPTVPPSGYNPVLDGLRALAVSAVIADHAGFRTRGFHGVTVFFVISGYLITTLLIQEHDRSGTLFLRGFYWRRLIRLGPALAVVLLATVGYLLLIRQPPGTYWLGPVGAATYSMDLIQALVGNAGVGIHFQWSWSLGVEEQFYLLWPIALLLLWRRGRRWIGPLLLGVVALTWMLRAAELAGGASHDAVFFGPVSHIDALVLGVLVAVLRARWAPDRAAQHGLAVLALLGGTGLLLLVLRIPTGLQAIDPDGFGQAAVFSTAVVLWASSASRGPGAAVLGSAPLAFIGRLSYGLYLWNILTVVVFVRLTGHHPAQTLRGVIWAAGLLALCTLSYVGLERPLRRRFRDPGFLRRTVEEGTRARWGTPGTSPGAIGPHP